MALKVVGSKRSTETELFLRVREQASVFFTEAWSQNPPKIDRQISDEETLWASTAWTLDAI